MIVKLFIPNAFKVPIWRVLSITVMNMVFIIPIVPTRSAMKAMPPRKALVLASTSSTLDFIDSKDMMLKSSLPSWTLCDALRRSFIFSPISAMLSGSETFTVIFERSFSPISIRLLALSFGMNMELSSCVIIPPLFKTPTTLNCCPLTETR